MSVVLIADYSQYHARLCQLRTWPDFAGYGFNLHGDRSKSGQFIGKVDSGSPAEAAGLRERDRIYEVNGVPVVDRSHAEVVHEIKQHMGSVDLLVVDPETDEHFQSCQVEVCGTMPAVEVISCPSSNPNAGKNAITCCYIFGFVSFHDGKTIIDCG